MTSYPNGYDLRFMLPKDYPYDANLLNSMSRSYFLELYGPAIEDRLSLRYDIYRFLINVISTTIHLQPGDETNWKTDRFFTTLFGDDPPVRRHQPSHTTMRLQERLSAERTIHYKELQAHTRDFEVLDRCLDACVTLFLDKLFRPEKDQQPERLASAAAGKVLCERLFAMRMNTLPSQV